MVGDDVSKVDTILDAPIAEVLYCYGNWLRAQAKEAYERDLFIWSNLAPHGSKMKQPEMPEILKK